MPMCNLLVLCQIVLEIPCDGRTTPATTDAARNIRQKRLSAFSLKTRCMCLMNDLSLKLDRIFVHRMPAAENTLSESTDVGGIPVFRY